VLFALLLGAGASRELGMPLRAEVNAELLAWLSPASLRRLNDTWRARGHGYPAEVIEDVARFLTEEQFDYEALLAHIETCYLDDARPGFAQAYHGLYAYLAQAVYQTLYRRQVERRNSYREGLQYFEGIVPLARQYRPLWVFSLNHDVLVECIAALFGIEVNCGFSPRTIALPCRNAAGEVIATLAAEVLGEGEMASGKLPFCVPGWPGVNLLKLYGALDVFGLGESQDLIRIKPNEETFDAIIDALQIANEGLLDPSLAATLAPEAMAVVNQIPYLDGDGRPQLLRRTLRASAARLTDPYPQLMQRRRLEYFRGSLAQVDHLAAIGYSMSDAEVNEIVRDWLAAARHRRLEIVLPGRPQLPTFLESLAGQVELTPASATTYLERFL
jgi:hypothetical protein